MSLSKEKRVADLHRALTLMVSTLGTRAFDSVEFDPSEQPFGEIQTTTWLELASQCLITEERYFGGARYRLTGFGWLEALEVTGKIEELKRDMAPLVAAMKSRVKGRHDPAHDYLDSISRSAGVSLDFAFNVIESDAITRVLNRKGASWHHQGKSIIIPQNFGLELL